MKYTLLTSRNHYKPFVYPWAYQYYRTQQSMHWLPTEVHLNEDVRDWESKLNEGEKHLLTQIFRFFTQADCDVAAGYCERYLPKFPHPELRMMMTSFAAMEAVHIDAYSLLIETIGLPETEYQAFQEYAEMKEKHEYLFEESSQTIQGLARDIAKFSAFSEGLQLFSSFVILLNFPRHGKMKGMGQIVSWSIRDESLHVEGMMKVFQTLIEENPHIWTKQFQNELYATARKMVELEDKFIDLCFGEAEIEGLTKDEVKQYIRYIADRRLLQLRLEPIFGVKKNPLPWVDYMVSGSEHQNFFEGRATEYSKGELQGDWDEAFV